MMRCFASPLFFGMVAAACLGQPSDSQPPVVENLWPAVTTGTVAALPAEKLAPSRGDGVVRITDVTRPSFLVYRPMTGTRELSPAVLVCPGGGYKHLAIKKEGEDVARWLNSIGVTAIVLKYTVPQNRMAAFRDAQRAMRKIRQHSSEWKIDPDKLGIMGFSAGAHLAARVSNDYSASNYPTIDEADKLSSRPDFTILIYPAYLADKQYKLADDVRITSETPPAFIVQTQDDRNFLPSSMTYAEALQKMGVPTELHIFPTGGHGYGLQREGHSVSQWPGLLQQWLDHQVK